MRKPTQHQIETTIPNVFALREPHQSFDPLCATNDELIAHGFPIRPGGDPSSKIYEHWANFVSLKRDWVIPKLIELPARKGLVQRISRSSSHGRNIPQLVSIGVDR